MSYETETATGLNLFANLTIELGNKIDKLAQAQERLANNLQVNTPILYRVVQSGVYPASGYLMLNMGGPDVGTYWNLRSVAIGGTDVNVTAAGKVGGYVSGYVSANTSPGLGALVDGAEWGQADQMPYTNQYSNEQIRLNNGENLSIGIFGGTAGQTYVANIAVMVYPQGAAKGVDVQVL